MLNEDDMQSLIEDVKNVIEPETDIRVLQQRAHANASAKGFHDYGRELSARIVRLQAIMEETPEHVTDSTRKELAFLEDSYRRYVGNAMMLIVGEASEAHEEVRNGREIDETYFSTSSGSPSAVKPLGFGSEMADIMIRLLDTAQELGIDMATEVAMKMKYNESRAHMHGKVM